MKFGKPAQPETVIRLYEFCFPAIAVQQCADYEGIEGLFPQWSTQNYSNKF